MKYRLSYPSNLRRISSKERGEIEEVIKSAWRAFPKPYKLIASKSREYFATAEVQKDGGVIFYIKFYRGPNIFEIVAKDVQLVDNKVITNPPMYAHHLYEKKTHGLNLHQMRRLYVMVSRGNQKAIAYARNFLGIPFDETPSQVKAVVKHHVIDLAERKVRRNPYTSRDIPYNMEWAGKTVIPRGTRVMRATNLPGNSYWAKGWRGMKGKERGWAGTYGFKIEAEDVVSKRPLRGNPGAKFVFVTIHHNYFHWRTDDKRSGGQPFSSNSELKSLLLKLKSLLGLRKDQIEIRDERGKK